MFGRHAAAKMIRKGKRHSREELHKQRRKSQHYLESRKERKSPVDRDGNPFSPIREDRDDLPRNTNDILKKSTLRRKLEEKYHLVKTIAMIKTFVPKHKDPRQYDGWTKSYLQFSNEVEKVVKGHTFRGFIIFVIVIAGFLVGLQTYDEWENNEFLLVLENIILVIFAIECLVKMLAEGLRPYMVRSTGLGDFRLSLSLSLSISIYLSLSISISISSYLTPRSLSLFPTHPNLPSAVLLEPRLRLEHV